MDVELYVCVDSAGDYGIGRDEDAALADYDENIGGTNARRVIQVALSVPEFKAVVMTGVVPEEAVAGQLTVQGGA